MKIEIYNYLNKIDKLDPYNYSNLIRKYDEKLVNEVIEEMIENNGDNLSKFEYYIKKIIVCDDSKVNAAFDAYLNELGDIKPFNNDDNMKYLIELNKITNDINNILSKYMIIDDSIWLCDKIDKFMNNKNITNEDLVNIKKLYKKYCDKRNDLVNGNLRFVIYVAKKFSRISKEFEELVQYGNIGLMKAIEKYDISYNNNFTTYAYYWVMQSITRNGSMDSLSMTVSHRLINLNIAIKKAKYKYTMIYGKAPTDSELAEILNISEKTIDDINRTFGKFVSLDSALSVDESDDMLKDFIPDDSVNVENEVITKHLVKEVRNILKESLSERDYDIICYRFSLDNHKFLSLQEIGELYGLSRERVRQIEAKTLSKLKVKGKTLMSYVD